MLSTFFFLQFILLGAVPFPGDVQRLKELGVHGVVTLNEPYETLVSTSLYHVNMSSWIISFFITSFLFFRLVAR